jgi:hypothetical protein
MQKCWRLAVVAATLAGLAVVAGEGCGGSSFSASGSDGGPGDASEAAADVSVDVGRDVLACLALPGALGNEANFCQTEQYVLETCGNCGKCWQSNLSNCVAWGDAISDPAKQALSTCQDQLACMGLNLASFLIQPCTLTSLAAAGQTPAQTMAKQAYCNACGVAHAQDCTDFFSASADAGTPPADAGGLCPPGSHPGFGLFVLLGSDAVADDIRMSCTAATPAGLMCDPCLYYLCSLSHLCKALPVDSCDTKFCK